jgi:signal transduction histidine kinase
MEPDTAGMTDQKCAASLKTLCRTLAILVAGVGLVVLLGWILDIAQLKGVFAGYATMKTNTALSFLLAGGTLWLAAGDAAAYGGPTFRRLLAAVIPVIAFLTLCEYSFGRDLGIDRILMRDPASSNRMSLATAICFLLIGLALLCVRSRRGVLAAQCLALAVAFLSFVAILAYIFNVRELYRVGVFSSMAVHTAVCLLMLAVGVLFLHGDRGAMFVISADSQGGKLARVSLPFVVAVPVLIGWVRLLGQNAGFYGTEFGLALYATSNVAIFVSTFWIYSWRLHRADTQLRQAHEQTLALNDTLEQRVAERTADLARTVAELEQFTVVASHDLQEPLRTIASYSQLLARRYRGRLDAEADEFIGFIVGGATRMKRLIQDLLDYGRLDSKKRGHTPVDMQSAVAEAIANLRFSIEESRATVTWDPLPVVAADKHLVVRLFQNLIGNAIKYRGPDPPRIHVSCCAGERAQVFSISDNGIGIEAGYREKIFAIFERLHTGENYEGTGIGLAISKKIVESHNGTIWVESIPGQGSTFYFSLPDKHAKTEPSSFAAGATPISPPEARCRTAAPQTGRGYAPP